MGLWKTRWWHIRHLKDFSHLSLLWKGTVVLDGQDDRHVGVDESRAVDRLHHILEDQKGKENNKNIQIRYLRLRSHIPKCFSVATVFQQIRTAFEFRRHFYTPRRGCRMVKLNGEWTILWDIGQWLPGHILRSSSDREGLQEGNSVIIDW